MFWFLICILSSVIAKNHVHYWTVRWRVLAPDGYPREVICVENQGDDYNYEFVDDVETKTIKLNGPELRVKQWDTLEVHVKNLLIDSVTSIHWHGIHMKHNAEMDGTVGLTQTGIAPGHTFVYKFEITQPPGTHWYHAHVSSQHSDGLQGLLIIEQNYSLQTFQYAFDYGVTLQDWTHESHVTLNSKYLSRSGTYVGFMADYPFQPISVLINGKGQFDCTNRFYTFEDCDDVRKYGWPYVLNDRNESFKMPPRPFSYQTNGQCNPSRPPYMGSCLTDEQHTVFQCMPNRSIRLRLINTGFSLGLRFWIDRHNMTIIARDGIDLSQPIHDINVVFLHVGERIDVRVGCNENPMYQYHVFAMVAYEYYGSTAHFKSPNVSSYAILDYQKRTTKTSLFLLPAIDPPTMWPQKGIKPWYLLPSPSSSSSSLYPATRIVPAACKQFVLESQSKGHWWNSENYTTGHRLEWWEINQHVPFYMPTNESIWDTCLKHVGNFTSVYGQFPKKPLVHHLVYDESNLRTYEFVLVNYESQPHPWHIHGYTVDVLAIEHHSQLHNWSAVDFHEPQPSLMRVDTFTIPSQSFIVFRLTADNPGPWLVHCHMDYHAQVGMAFLLSVEKNGEPCNYDFKHLMLTTVETNQIWVYYLGFFALGCAMACFLIIVITIAHRLFTNWIDRRRNRQALFDHYTEDVLLLEANKTVRVNEDALPSSA